MSIKKTFKASSVREVLELLDEYKHNAKIIAGGTDLVIEIRNEQLEEEVLIDISSIEEIRHIKEKDGFIHIGAGTRFSDIVESSKICKSLNGLRKSARLVGSPLIRNRGTVGGNICNASPAADLVPPLIALGAMAALESLEGMREVKVEDIFLSKGRVDISNKEILTEIRFKKPTSNQCLGFSKLGLRNALAISRICIAVFLDLDENNIIKDIVISSGSLGKHALREKDVEDVMKGKELNQNTIELSTKKLVEIVKDRLKGRSSLLYKSEAVKSLFVEAITLAKK